MGDNYNNARPNDQTEIIFIPHLVAGVLIKNELRLFFSEPEFDDAKSEPKEFCVIRDNTKSVLQKIVNNISKLFQD